MNTTLLSRAHLSENPASLTSEQKRELVQRVLGSQLFSRSPAMRAFLLFITEHAISGQVGKLKEQTIGAEVLGRRPNYDPAEDNIVRVRAHELRGRLEKYFATEGSEEPVVITVPKGSYIPEFAPRHAAVPAAPPAPQPVALPAEKHEPSPLRYWLPWLAVLAVAVAASVGLTRYALRNNGRPVPASGAMRDFWGQFFDKPNQELKIVYADTSFALWQDLNNRTLNLGDYLSHNYLGLPGDRLDEVAARRATSPADITVSVHLATLAAEFGGQVNPQFARSANAEFFLRGNVVLIGSHRSNPWIEVYEPGLNFDLGQDPHTGAPLFRNRSPLPREASAYAIPAMLDEEGAEKEEFTSYGVVALLKGCGSRGRAVLDEGLNMQATQAGGDLLTDPQRLDTLLRSIGHKPGTTVTPFEVLFAITSLPGGYDNPKVIAYRLRSLEACAGD